MKTEVPSSITIDTEQNRFPGPAYRILDLPAGHEMESVAPMVMIPSGELNEAIEQYRAGNQKRVNELLSKYY